MAIFRSKYDWNFLSMEHPGECSANSFDRPLMPIFIPYNIFVSDDDVNTFYEESSCEFFALSLKFSRSVELKKLLEIPSSSYKNRNKPRVNNT